MVATDFSCIGQLNLGSSFRYITKVIIRLWVQNNLAVTENDYIYFFFRKLFKNVAGIFFVK